MSPRRTTRTRNSIGMLALGLVLAADVALGVWAWHRYRGRQAESRAFDVVEAPMAAAPFSEDPLSQAPPPAAPPPSSERDRFARAPAAPASPAPAAGRPAAPAPRAAGRGARSRDPSLRAQLPLAEKAYRTLKGEPRFRALAKAWTEEFVRYRDLRRINHRYWQDRDALRFVVSAVQSPSFLRVLTRFSSRPDLQDFMRQLARAPGVGPTARLLLEDPKTSAAVQRLQLAGLPPVGAFSRAGRGGPDAQLPPPR
ncbi:MAG: hypothetical protein HY554_16045 [Elusimicrobia bacterium]|nr:hypothetical protein [Elusimicrobiota bacterium]